MSQNSPLLDINAHDVYVEYKKRQKILTRWLAKVTSSDEDAKYSLRKIDEMAEDAVADQVPIPPDILYLASSLVHLRKEVGLYYQDGDTGHIQCIASLQMTVNRLKQLPVVGSKVVIAKNLNSASEHQMQKMNRFDILRALKDQQHVYNQPTLPSISEPTAVMIERETQTDVLSRQLQMTSEAKSNVISQNQAVERLAVAFFHMQAGLFRAYKSCIEAFEGKVPWLVATYILERANINVRMKWLMMLHDWDVCAGTRSQNSTDLELLDDIVREIETLTRTNENHVLHLLPSATVNTTMQLDCLLTVLAALHKDSSFGKALCASKRSPPYRDLVPRPGDDAGDEFYDIKLLQSLELDDYLHRTSKDPSGKHNRTLETCRIFSQAPPRGVAMMKSTILLFLQRCAKCFEFGSTYGFDPSPASTLEPSNYRLKALAFARQALDTIKQHGPPDIPWIAPPNVYQNLRFLRAKLTYSLKDNRFDLTTQHPAIAGGDILLYMDLLYAAGFNLLAYHRGGTGVLHIYNALRSVNVLDKEIPILEELCKKLEGPLFYGNRPTKKFCRFFRDVDDYDNTFQFSAREYKSVRPRELLKNPIPAFDDVEDQWEMSERGQVQLEQGRLGINQRLQANDFSLFHRVYNQKDDMKNDVDPLILKELVGDAAPALATFDVPGFNRKHLKSSQEIASKLLDERGCLCSSDARLDILEEALVKEFQDPFPLIKVNLVKVWKYCLNFLTRAGAQGGYDTGIGDRARQKTALLACEEVQRQAAGSAAVSLPKDHVLSKWKRAFRKEFGESSLQDFMWRNL